MVLLPDRATHGGRSQHQKAKSISWPIYRHLNAIYTSLLLKILQGFECAQNLSTYTLQNSARERFLQLSPLSFSPLATLFPLFHWWSCGSEIGTIVSFGSLFLRY